MKVRITHNKTYITKSSDLEEMESIKALKIIYARYEGNRRIYEKTVNLYDNKEKSFPTGYLTTFVDKLDKKGIDITAEDDRCFCYRNSIMLPKINREERWENQIEAQHQMDENPNGFLSSVTGSGKSKYIIDAIDLFRVRTIILAPTEVIRDSLYEELSELFGSKNVANKFKNDDFSMKDKKNVDKRKMFARKTIDINEDINPYQETPEDIYKNEKGYEKIGDKFVKVRRASDPKDKRQVNYPSILVICPDSIPSLPVEYVNQGIEMIICDEGHTGCREDVRQLRLEAENAMYCYATSATNWRDRKEDMHLLFSVFGSKIVFEEIPKDSIAKGIVKKVIYTQDSAPEPKEWLRDMKNADDIIKRGIVGNETRNIRLVEKTLEWLSLGRRIMICVGETAHIDILKTRLEKEGIIALEYHSKMSSAEKRDVKKISQETLKPIVILATMALGIGADTKKIDSIVLAGGGKSSNQTIQRNGRGGRKDDQTDELWIYDLFDWFNPKTMEWSHERKKIINMYYFSDVSMTRKMAKKHKLKHT
jgi:superfamily II DNA or RNA helicase